MHVIYELKHVAAQLVEALNNLSDEVYTQPVAFINSATIGQHVRHITGLFDQLFSGYETGEVNYDNRIRDTAVENHRKTAIEKLKTLATDSVKEEKTLLLVCNYGNDGEPLLINTTYTRELVYNVEHAVHHLALIRVGIQYLTPLQLPGSFGVASSTLKYKKACAQ